MQRSIKRSLAKAAKDKEGPKSTNEIKKSHTTRPSLIRLLSSQIIPRSTGNATETSGDWRINKRAALSEKPNLNSTSDNSHHPLPPANSVQAHAETGYPNSLPATKKCPLCGENVLEQHYDDHFQAELDGLAAGSDDDDNIWDPPQQPQPPKRARAPHSQTKHTANYKIDHCRPVYVIGGAPSVAVPKDPKKLKPLPKEMKRSFKPARAYNHYEDGSGVVDGDDFGLDGHANMGIGWEGVGATTF